MLSAYSITYLNYKLKIYNVSMLPLATYMHIRTCYGMLPNSSSRAYLSTRYLGHLKSVALNKTDWIRIRILILCILYSVLSCCEPIYGNASTSASNNTNDLTQMPTPDLMPTTNMTSKKLLLRFTQL